MQASGAEPNNGHPYDDLQLFTIQSSPSEDPAGNQIYHGNDERRRQQPTKNIAISRHVLSAMIAVLALSFLTMVATLILTIRMMPTGASETKGMAEEIQQLIELSHKIIASKANETGREPRVCDKAKNCAELYKAGKRISGVYTIDPDGEGAFEVFCDQKTSGGGWTVFQKRLDGSVSFYNYWDDYKNGFGNLNGEFWLGLEKIYRLTEKKRNRLRVDLEETTGNTAYAEYDMFAVTHEATKYKLSLGNYSGTAGDSLTRWHRNQRFSIRDQDHDSSPQNCAVRYRGAWWYSRCHHSNLNGFYYNGSHSSYGDGVNWHSWKGYHYSAKRAEMKIRPVNF